MSDTARPWQRNAALAVLVVAVALGAGVRLVGLTVQSLWLDELFSVVFSRSELAVAEIVRVYADDVHPVGYPLLLHGWLVVFGDTDLAARSLSAVLGVLGIVVVFGAARRLGGPEMGAIAALLVAVNPMHIEYSQEARSYALVFLLAAASFAALVELVHRPRWRSAVAYGAATAAAAHVHYYALVMLLGQAAAAAAVLIVRRAGWREWRAAVLGASLVGVAVLPWLGPLRRVAAMDEYWPPPPQAWFFIDYFHDYFGHNLLLTLVMAVLVAAGATAAVWSRDRDGSGAAVLPPAGLVAWLLGGPVAVGLLVVYLRSVAVVPMLMPRFTLVFLPALLMLAALGASLLRPPVLRRGTVSAVAVLAIAGILWSGYYTDPRKAQWREAVQHMVSDHRFDSDQDACLATLAPGFQYYANQLQPGFEVGDATLDGLRTLLDRRPRPVLWLLLAPNNRPGKEFRRLQRQHWVRADRVRFLETAVERWEPVN